MADTLPTITDIINTTASISENINFQYYANSFYKFETYTNSGSILKLSIYDKNGNLKATSSLVDRGFSSSYDEMRYDSGDYDIIKMSLCGWKPTNDGIGTASVSLESGSASKYKLVSKRFTGGSSDNTNNSILNGGFAENVSNWTVVYNTTDSIKMENFTITDDGDSLELVHQTSSEGNSIFATQSFILSKNAVYNYGIQYLGSNVYFPNSISDGDNIARFFIQNDILNTKRIDTYITKSTPQLDLYLTGSFSTSIYQKYSLYLGGQGDISVSIWDSASLYVINYINIGEGWIAYFDSRKSSSYSGGNEWINISGTISASILNETYTNGHIQFNGSDTIGELEPAPLSSSYLIENWIAPVTGSDMTLLNDNSDLFELKINANGTITFIDSSSVITTTETVNNKKFNYIIIYSSGSENGIWLNGEFVKTGSSTETNYVLKWIGNKQGSSNWYEGYYDVFKIYNVPNIDKSEINSFYENRNYFDLLPENVFV